MIYVKGTLWVKKMIYREILKNVIFSKSYGMCWSLPIYIYIYMGEWHFKWEQVLKWEMRREQTIITLKLRFILVFSFGHIQFCWVPLFLLSPFHPNLFIFA